ncbi:MAG: hypothetical protein H6822_21250 [Planctomycetaceae bacterium]|nr:hypothetical protein [Planctomycetales bacterium]MCB9924721.1 hypothetical protein [Planctomycetaceae bacterium]
MFGKPTWFERKRRGWGIKPTCWQGWIYSAVWTAVLILPFLALVSEGLLIESLVWSVASMAALVWDVREVIHAMSPVVDDVLYIDETETLSERLATRNYDFRLRG